MNQLGLLTFRTTFRVIAADRALAEAAIVAGLTPTPAGVSSPCGLSLRMDAALIPQALAQLAAANIQVDGVYVLNNQVWQAQR